MQPFNRLPGSRRSPSGLEWAILKKLPAAMLAGSTFCAGLGLLLHLGWFGLQAKDVLTAQYMTIGLLLFFWISVATVGLACVIVVIMKGHAYVRDPYALPDSDQPGPDASHGRRH